MILKYLFHNFYFFLFFFFLVCTTVSLFLWHFKLIHFSIKKQIRKFEIYYFIIFNENIDFTDDSDFSLFSFFLGLFYFVIFGPMYASAWLSFYTLKYTTFNTFWEFEEIIFLIIQFNFISWFYLYSFSELFFFFYDYYLWLYFFWLSSLVAFYPDFLIIFNLLN